MSIRLPVSFFLLALSLVLSGCGPSGGGAKKEGDAVAVPDTVEKGCLGNHDCENEGQACMVGACVEGECVIEPGLEGEACEADACFSSQICTGGVCGGGDPVAVACEAGSCNPDVCGNPCVCDGGLECVAGNCQAPPCGEITGEGCCMPGEGIAKWCGDNGIESQDCAALGGVCTWRADDGFYGCGAPTGVAVNPDPNVPYLCPGEACDGTCEGKTCGTDGCGTTCGECSESETCEEGVCEACSCDGIECGEDPCGNVCGECGEGETCVTGACKGDPCGFTGFEGCCKDQLLNFCDPNGGSVVDCGDGGCGWDENGNKGNGWYDCGGAGPDPEGLFPLACLDPLDPPSCTDAADCPAPQMACTEYTCVEEKCVIQSTEGGTACDDNSCYTGKTCLAKMCQGGTLIPKDCSGLTCGPDACGYDCGECLESMICEEGTCVPDLPLTYSLKIQPILQQHCAPCHDNQKKGGHNLAASYPDAVKDASHPDCPGMSVAACSVLRITNGSMPKGNGGTVPDEDLELLKDWVADGMKL